MISGQAHALERRPAGELTVICGFASEDGYPTWESREKNTQLMDAHKRLSSHHRHNHDELTIYPINSSSASIDIVDGGASKTFNNHNVKFDFELQSRLRELGS